MVKPGKPRFFVFYGKAVVTREVKVISGDSDFEPAVEHLRKIGKKVIIVSARGHVSRELIRAGNRYLPLEAMKDEIMLLK